MFIQKPEEIERESFAIISDRLQGYNFSPDHTPIVKRVIHTTADFDFAENMHFTPDAVKSAQQALQQGAHIICDTNMVLAGINKTILGRLGGEAHCYMADAQVAEEAKARGTTRAAVSMEQAVLLTQPLVFAIGNAPTALIRLHQLIRSGQVLPKLVVAAPVGFVNVVESKELFLDGAVPAIVARGQKGGSPVAAAIINAILYQIAERE